jgi:hypothetical protein
VEGDTHLGNSHVGAGVLAVMSRPSRSALAEVGDGNGYGMSWTKCREG